MICRYGQCCSDTETGRTMCSVHLTKEAEKTKRWRNEKASSGICTSCPNPTDGTRKRCAVCTDKQKQYRVKFVAVRKMSGLCLKCKSRAETGRTLCSLHLDRHKNSEAAKRQRNQNALKKRKKVWKEQGLCDRCGGNIEVGRRGSTRCQPCFEKAVQRKRRLWQLRTENGLCKYCGLNPAISICSICFLKQRSKRHFGTRDRWEELQQVYDNQSGKCPYTGKELTLGVNTSLDHQVARASDGETVPDNLQWVYSGSDFDINVMKSDFAHDAFLEAIKQIYQHCIGGACKN